MDKEFGNDEFDEGLDNSLINKKEDIAEKGVERPREEFEEAGRPRRDYDYGYYEKQERPKKKKSKLLKYVAFALVFSIIGSLIGTTLGFKLASEKLKKQLESNKETYTINTSDNINTVSAVAKTNLDSVVGITTKTLLRDIFNRQYESQAMGSGFIVDAKGYIVTNNHVIESLSNQNQFSNIFGESFGEKKAEKSYADEITVLLNDGSQIPASIVWADKSLDLAVLKVESEKPLQAVKLGDSDKLIIGEPAIAIGNPLAIEFHGTVTAGYISGKDRRLKGQDGTEMSLIQTDASINPGNSGGPLLNSKGEVIGVNTMKISSGEGLGFSIPINVAKPIIDQIIQKGEFDKVTLGFSGADLEKYENAFQVDTGLDGGVVVMNVIEGSPMAKAGFRQLDIITKLEGVEIKAFSDLSPLLYKYKIGDTVEIEYVRDNQTNTAKVLLEKFSLDNK